MKKPTALSPKSYSSVIEMVRDLLGDEDPKFVARFERASRARDLIRMLSVLRNRSHLSQKELAEKMGCGQPRISKLESGTDADVSVHDIIGYLRATGSQAKITFFSCDGVPLGEVKLEAPEPESKRPSKRKPAARKPRSALSGVR